MNKTMNKITNSLTFLTIPIVFLLRPIRFILRWLFIPMFIMIISPYLSIIYSFIDILFTMLRFLIFIGNMCLLYEIIYGEQEKLFLCWSLFCYAFLLFAVKKIGRLIIKCIKKMERIIRKI